VKIGGTTYDFTYDANGNLIQENSSRFTEWDHADRMRCFYIDNGGTVTKYAHYLYDAGGNRVKKLVRNDGGSYTSTSYIDGFYEYLTDGTDEQSLSHVMDDKSRIAMVLEGDMFGDTKPTIRYVIEDRLGNSVNELKYDGANIEKEEYYPFGETSFASYSRKRYKYNGKERDEESGFYNYGMRYYNAWTCRFISVDPIKDDYPELTSYQYSSNRPINMIDLDGLEGVDPPVETFADPAPPPTQRPQAQGGTGAPPMDFGSLFNDADPSSYTGSSAPVKLNEEFAALFDNVRIPLDFSDVNSRQIANRAPTPMPTIKPEKGDITGSHKPAQGSDRFRPALDGKGKPFSQQITSTQKVFGGNDSMELVEQVKTQMTSLLSDHEFDNTKITTVDIEFDPNNPASVSNANSLAKDLTRALDNSIEVKMQAVKSDALNNNNVQVTVHAQGFKNGS
jgi:RHS repeat-associated protein